MSHAIVTLAEVEAFVSGGNLLLTDVVSAENFLACSQVGSHFVAAPSLLVREAFSCFGSVHGFSSKLLVVLFDDFVLPSQGQFGDFRLFCLLVVIVVFALRLAIAPHCCYCLA